MAEIPSPVAFHGPPNQKIHRKSRNGCKICKARKIKCDEAHPFCGNCYRRFPNPEQECEYELSSPRLSYQQGSSSSSTSITSTFSSTLTTSRALELRLFHHYSTITCHTMPTCEEPAGLNMWKHAIPSLAFEVPHIYSAILGIAAQHLLSLLPDDANLKIAAYQYIDETLTAHRKEMSSLESRNPLQRFTTSMLLTMHAKLRTRYEMGSGMKYTPPVNYFILQYGAKNIFEARDDWGDDLKAAIECFSHLAPRDENWAPPEFEFNSLMNVKFPSDNLSSFILSDISIPDERKAVYLRALSYLELIKHCIATGERAYWIRHRIAIAVSVFGPKYRVMMQEEDLICLLILARMYALQKCVDEPWWLEGTAEYEVRGLYEMVDGEWKWGMEWPMEVLETSFLFVANENRGMA